MRVVIATEFSKISELDQQIERSRRRDVYISTGAGILMDDKSLTDSLMLDFSAHQYHASGYSEHAQHIARKHNNEEPNGSDGD